MAKVNDMKVQSIIKAEINTAAGSTLNEKMDNVRKSLKAKRNVPGKSLDMDMAAAEHYAFMRYLAGNTGDPMTETMPRGYEMKKIVMSFVGMDKSMQHNPANPASPPDEDVVRWGEKGAREGLEDYKFLHNQKLGTPGSALSAVRAEALRL